MNLVTVAVCLACADGDHHACYGYQCDCYCGGELAGTNPKWNDNLIQFARLLAEIRATQDRLDFGALAEEMDLDFDDIESLFDRADNVWERAKGNIP